MDSTYNALKRFSGMGSPKADMLVFPQSVTNSNFDQYDYNDYYQYNSTKPGKYVNFLGEGNYIKKDDDDGATYLTRVNPEPNEESRQRVIVSGPMSTTLPYAASGNKLPLNNRAFENHGHNIRTVIPVDNDATWENMKLRKDRGVKSGPMNTNVPSYARPQTTQTSKPVKKAEPVKTATLNLTPKAAPSKAVPSWVDRDNEINAKYANMQPVEDTAPVVNTPKPVQKNTRPVYMPMSTDQAVELYRRQRYN